MDKETGGQAFPVPGLSNLPNGEFIYPTTGMELRDYFAAGAMNSLLQTACSGTKFGANYQDKNLQYAKASYAIADAMLEARK
jgi:hypothetical protein